MWRNMRNMWYIEKYVEKYEKYVVYREICEKYEKYVVYREICEICGI